MQKLTIKNQSELLEFLNQDYINNLFFIGDLIEFGFDDTSVKSYGFYENNKLKAAIMLFHSTLLISDPDNFISKEELIEFIKNQSVSNIITEQECAQHINELIKKDYQIEIKQEEILVLNRPITQEGFISNFANRDDLSLIIDGRKTIEEFKGVSAQGLKLDYLQRTYDTGFYIPFIIKEQNIVASHASVACMTPKAAMIGGVYTLKEHRKKGYASDCVLNLCKWLQNKHKTPVLFFDNPLAGSVYKKIGFEHFGLLNVMILKEKGDKNEKN
ncbi:hypothetical protein C4M98_00650 [Mycoplasmopsis pullorum]|uniref:GNAT family N-acetyltransferase n=1 Tax=Mycoplasmopsis pullorum TaxID=48003 RepID=UPI001119BA5A|nr:GNAT family N-acetyltransferase [Mycoplasmopsis pullorum]TNK82101.1 hypothetical protein C4M94_02010 [Mycoplasmopsis pullorum]TNK83215.1 hypothetical protein C4M80_01100 [Mycoplasmopsis pullorum]TNK85440.1 hypothetical protein C4M92_01410 [Mycoplasmopsis pullorum]TNK86185.1 hypothetical protein C4M85_00940 [Mycoplasmopsis pullorum]TNK86661.1 hypothetical protein C4M82_02470 [Mycoplasmopsis pullorum]